MKILIISKCLRGHWVFFRCFRFHISTSSYCLFRDMSRVERFDSHHEVSPWKKKIMIVPKILPFKTMLSVKPFSLERVLFAWEWKLIFISMVSHLASLWNRGLGQNRSNMTKSVAFEVLLRLRLRSILDISVCLAMRSVIIFNSCSNFSFRLFAEIVLWNKLFFQYRTSVNIWSLKAKLMCIKPVREMIRTVR